MSNEIGFEVRLQVPFVEAVERVTAALKIEGFGVLTRIDVQATFKEKLDESFRPFVILGACNPPLSFRALNEDPVVGLMLPCNITVEETEPGQSLVRIANPEILLMVGALKQSEELVKVSSAARAHLERVAEALVEEG
jgi:uncharacterized protein (DUF302 family)